MEIVKFLSGVYQKIKNFNRIEKPIPIGCITFKSQIIGEVLDTTPPTHKIFPGYKEGTTEVIYRPEILVSKITFDVKSAPLIFERGFVNKLSQQEPFQMVCFNGRNKLVFCNCMIKKMKAVYPVDNSIIAEGVELIADEVKFYLR